MICATLTWLRNFKRTKYESSLEGVAEEFKGEPDWIVSQMLRQRRDELARKWEEREQRLQKIREKEKKLTERSTKRRRLVAPSSPGKTKIIDEEKEFLLDNWNGAADASDNDPFSSFSSETRALMEKVGLAGSSTDREPEEEEVEDQIKVPYTSASFYIANGGRYITLPERTRS